MARATASVRRAERDLEERFEPLNRLLDAFETLVLDLTDRGLETQLRARLERLLPPPKATAATGDRLLEYTNLLAFLRSQASRRHTAAEHERWQHFARVISAEVEDMREAA